MLKHEYYLQYDGIDYYITFSDSNFKIQQHPTELLLNDAIDPEGSPFTYTETDIPIEDPVNEEDYEEALIKLGVNI